MDFSKILSVLQVIQGVAGLLGQIFQNVQTNAHPTSDVSPHVETIHNAVVGLSPQLNNAAGISDATKDK
jgi:hypothetical protein